MTEINKNEYKKPTLTTQGQRFYQEFLDTKSTLFNTPTINTPTSKTVTLFSEEDIHILGQQMEYEKAKAEILKVIDEKMQLYYSDLLRLTPYDLETIVKVCDELMVEGKVRDAKP